MPSLGLKLPADYKPSSGELDNICYLVLKYTVGWQMRQADLQVCLLMAGDIVGDEGISRFVEVTCEYAWDHITGSPTEPTAEQLFDSIAPALRTWYENTTPEQRAVTS